MVKGPAIGKAGNCLDWVAGGLEMNGIKDYGRNNLRLVISKTLIPSWLPFINRGIGELEYLLLEGFS